jgi:GH24 family phage-related lysozyme (muramidase)
LNINGEITKEMAEKLLDISMDTAIRQAWDIFPQFGGFSERRQMALVDWLFNVGIGTALTFRRALAAISAGEWGKAADAMEESRWFEQVKSRGIEIVEMVRNG